MLEPYEGKLSRTVLRGEGSRNAPALPDQIIENKQRFISQIMTSKTPVRSADDVDEATLSYAEIKAIATGSPLIKEKMDIDVKLERLKIARSQFLKSHEQLEYKVIHSYPQKIRDAKDVLANLRSDISTIKQNTVLGDDGQERFSISINGNTFSDKKTASKFIADFIHKNIHSLAPLSGLYGEFKGLHFHTSFDRTYLREEILLEGKTTSRKFSSAIAGDNINRIVEMANSLIKYAEEKQSSIDILNSKIRDAKLELVSPFPQQEESDKLLMRSTELSLLLNQDADSNEKNKAEVLLEQQRRVKLILNNEPDSLCEKTFFSFAQNHLHGGNDDWNPSLDLSAITLLFDKGFSKDNISNTLIKFSPSVPSKESVTTMVENFCRRAASR